MKNQKSPTYQRENRINKIEVSKNKKSLSPKIEKPYTKEKSPKTQDLFTKDLLENTRKYIEMSNGNKNYFLSPISPKIDFSPNFNSPTLNEELNITQKYNDIYQYNDYSNNILQDEYDNDAGNEKLHKVKDEYIEYLQRQLDENNKNVISLESKLNELQKKFKNLIDDNRILNETLNERGIKLNEFIQENENLRLQINNYIDNETKYKLQFQYYEKQIKLYETNINDYNKIINDLKVTNEKLTNNLNENLDNKKIDINNIIKKNNNNFNSYNYFEVKNITNNTGELQLMKNQNMIFANEIKSKDYALDLANKKNQKLMNENKIFKAQIQQYAQQMSNLYNILKQKNKIINSYKQKEGNKNISVADDEFDKKLDELNMNFINNNELLLNISKNDDILTTNTRYNYDNFNINNNDKLNQLISDNEKNKKRIDLLNNKIKTLNESDNKNIISNNLISKNILNNNLTNNNYISDNIVSNINTNNNNKLEIVIPKSLIRSPLKKEKENGDNNNKYGIGNSWRFLVSPVKNKNEKEDVKNKIKEVKTNNYIDNKRNIIKIDNNLNNDEKKKEQNIKKDENKDDKIINGKDNKPKHIKFAGILDEKNEIKDNIRDINRKKNNSHVPKVKKKFKISDFLDITEINTSSPVAPQNLSFTKDDTEYINSLMNGNNLNSIYLFGIDRDDYFYIFDLKDKKLSKKKILEIEDISDTFQKDYQYEGTILYNTLDGLFILTGKKSDILYYYNSKYDTLNKICQFNNSHDNGSLLLDKEYNRLFALGGKETNICEYYSFQDKKLYSIPNLTIDRANASYIICNNKIYGFFGFSYKNNKYCGNIECIDNKRLDKWNEIKNIKFLKENINFEVESVSTLIYQEDNNKILLYSGIQGDNEDYVTENYYLYDTKENSIDLIGKWENNIMKYVGSRWRHSNLTKKDPAGYHFAKNSNFLKLPKSLNIEGYKNDIYLLMDYKNNIHFIDQDEKTIDIYKSEI